MTAESHIASIFSKHYGKACCAYDVFGPISQACRKVGITVEAEKQAARRSRISNNEGKQWLSILGNIGGLSQVIGFGKRRTIRLEYDAFLKGPGKPDKQSQKCQQNAGDCQNRCHHAWSGS